MRYKTKDYVVIEKAISEDLTNFLFNYLKLKQKVLRTMVDSNYISEFNVDFGRFGDSQVPDQYCIFGDPAFDSLLDLIKPKLEKEQLILSLCLGSSLPFSYSLQ